MSKPTYDQLINILIDLDRTLPTVFYGDIPVTTELVGAISKMRKLVERLEKEDK